jgi:alpha-galactosidase
LEKSVLLNTEMIAVSQDSLVKPGRRVKGAANLPQVWAKALANGDQAVVFYNAGDVATADISVTWDEIGVSCREYCNRKRFMGT